MVRRRTKSTLRTIFLLLIVCIVFSLIAFYVAHFTRSASEYRGTGYQPMDVERQQWLEKKVK